MDNGRLPQFYFFGDSLTSACFDPSIHGWLIPIANHYVNRVDLIIRSFSGYNSYWASIVLPSLLSKQPDYALYTVFLGANDAIQYPFAQHIPLHQYSTNLLSIINTIKQISSSPIILITPPTVNGNAWDAHMISKSTNPSETTQYGRDNQTTSLYAEQCRIVAEKSGCVLIDLYSEMMKMPDHGFDCLSDGLHLNQKGNEALSNLWMQIVSTKLPHLYNHDHLPTLFPHWSRIDSNQPHSTLFTGIDKQ